jgi:hypothetical protein
MQDKCMKKSDNGTPENFSLSDCYFNGIPDTFTNISNRECGFGQFKEADNTKCGICEDRKSEE